MTSPEGDEAAGRVEDNSLGRLLALSDGVFAIAMTLLALDLRVPDLGDHPTDAALRHALADNAASYLSYLVSFYNIAAYWLRHRRLMRSVTTIHPKLFTDTILLLLVVAALPFPASLLGQYGSVPTSLVVYGVVNALAILALVRLRHHVLTLGLSQVPAEPDGDSLLQTWLTLAVFVLCVPAGYVLGRHGPYVLLLLVVAGRAPAIRRRWNAWRARAPQS